MIDPQEFAHQPNWFDYKYRDKLGKRFNTFRRVLHELASSPTRVCVETGCVRERDDYGAGYSTFILGEYLSWYGGELHTVDITPRHIQTCKKITKKFAPAITYHTCDSEAFLRTFSRPIDFLYLDSFDYPSAPSEGPPRPSQEHCLAELKAALPNLHRGALVLIDDSRLPGGGKPGLTIPHMKKLGWACLLDEYQTLWRVS